MSIVKVSGVLTRWAVKRGKLEWTQTCHNSTCCCASHDPGFHWTEVGPEAGRYIDRKGQRVPGNPHSHGYITLEIPSARPKYDDDTATTCRSICGLPYLTEEEKGRFCRAAVDRDDGYVVGHLIDAQMLSEDRIRQHREERRAAFDAARKVGLMSVGLVWPKQIIC